MSTITIAPQDGPQTWAMASKADIVFMGGGAGGGKSRWLLMEGARYYNVKGYAGAIFRRTSPELTRGGGLWDDSFEVCSYLNGVPRTDVHDWRWPQYGSSLSFSHLQYLKDVYSWKSAQLAFIGLDEVTSFEELMFWYMFSRNRSVCGVKPCIRATCNPEPGSWVAKFLDWWIGADGFADATRDGLLRWFVRDSHGKILWADRRDQLPDPGNAKSVTFIRSRLEDNPALTTKDPGYRATLLAMPLYERRILLDGNWKVRKSAGTRFRRVWFKVVKAPSAPVVRTVRYWDRAGTEPSDTNQNPDHTAGVKVSLLSNGRYCVRHVHRERNTPAKVRASIDNLASQDTDTELYLEEDPGQAGKAEAEVLAIELAEHAPQFVRATGSKWDRSANASSAAERGLIEVEEGEWNEDFFNELEGFCDPAEAKRSDLKDDQVDGLSGAFNALATDRTLRVRRL